MDTFYCVGCRFVYPMEKSAKITTGVHRDGQAVGFCFICARDIVPAGEADNTVLAAPIEKTGTV